MRSLDIDPDPPMTFGFAPDGTPRRMALSEALAQIDGRRAPAQDHVGARRCVPGGGAGMTIDTSDSTPHPDLS
jgi:hypothetical protein